MPLPPTAFALLEERREQLADAETHVFPGLTVWTDDYRALSRLTDGAYEWKDLRRTVGTRLAALGFKEETIGRALNHARYTVTARHYINHAYTAEVGRALEAWDRLVDEIVAGRSGESGKVRAFQVAASARSSATRSRPSTSSWGSE